MLQDGDSFEWEQLIFDVFHAPGQTEFHSVLAADIDGQRVAFTGDNYFLDEVLRDGQVTVKPYQTTAFATASSSGCTAAASRSCAGSSRS